jgi:hypothetical protein
VARVSQATDRLRLGEIADELEVLKPQVDALIEERRTIWHRRDKSNGGDTERQTLADWSRTSRTNIIAGLRPHLAARPRWVLWLFRIERLHRDPA